MINGSIYSCLIKLFNFFVGCYLHQVSNIFFKVFTFFIKTKTWAIFFFQLHFLLYIFETRAIFVFSYIFYFIDLFKTRTRAIFFSVTFFNVIFKTITSLQSIQNVNHIGKTQEHFEYRLPLVKKRGYDQKKIAWQLVINDNHFQTINNYLLVGNKVFEG